MQDDEDEEWDWVLRMNDIAINLNHIDEELEKVLPPTDSWRWPDMRAMERGDYETADWEKKSPKAFICKFLIFDKLFIK